MAAHLSFLLIITALTGIHSITTVSKVSVKRGGSITIPCLYDQKYKNHVKYLCRGFYYSSCSYAVKTNKPDGSGKFSISDDKKQSIFTVTIKDLTHNDAGYWWCVVETNNGADVGVYFHLSVTTETSRLYVDQQNITGFIGDNGIISCKHRNRGVKKFCRLGGNCVTGSGGSVGATTVTIDESLPSVFTVTMRGLTIESSGWYWCDTGDFQMPVHLTVTEKPTTTKSYETETTHATKSYSTALSSTSEPEKGEDNKYNSDQETLKRLIIPLSLLLFIVMVSLFVWFMLKRNKQTKAESSASAMAEDKVVYSAVKYKRKPGQIVVEKNTGVQLEGDVIYSDVRHLRKPTHKMSDAKRDVEAVYSSTVKRRVEANSEDVTYTTQNQ